MKRRNFLRTAGALGLSSFLPLQNLYAESNSKLTSLINSDSDKVLVLIQLFGGNDGLNTVVPLDQYGNLTEVRGNIMVPESRLLPITPTLGLHPKMGDMQDMFSEGTLGIIQNVGYPNSNRSHFRSSDIWSSGSDARTIDTMGWLGKYLDGELPNFPTGYPDTANPHPPAISIGKIVHPSCQGPVFNFSQTFDQNVDTTAIRVDGDEPLPSDNFGKELAYLRTIAEQTNEYGTLMEDAYSNGATQEDYPSSYLGNQLKTVARLIDGGLQTKVYTVRINGFDTHANQVQGDGTRGKHALLLEEVSEAIAAFQSDLQALGHADRVLGMTYSEFGRRIRSNESRGSDHGSAGMMFLFGTCLQQQILGNNPTIDTQVSQSADLPMEYDFRDVYGSILQDWFKVSESRIRRILYRQFTYLPVIGTCAAGRFLPVDLFDFVVRADGKSAKLSWKTAEEVDNRGFEVEVSADGRRFSFLGWQASKNPVANVVTSYEMADSNLEAGRTYFYRIKAVANDGEATYSPVRSVHITGRTNGEWSIGSPYPNPAQDTVTLPCFAPTDSSFSYTLMDQSGKLMLSDSKSIVGGSSVDVRIRLGRLPSGTYTLKVNTHGSGSATRRVVVQ